MEDREHIKPLTFLAILGPMLGIFVVPLSVSAYSVETHAYLTEEIVDFYNQHHPNIKIAENLRSFLIDGSRQEDNAPRWINHFYDPVYDRGLDVAGGPKGHPSKRWAINSEWQTQTKYKAYALANSLLTAAQEMRLGAVTTESDFTWDRAIEFWVRGEKEKAMFTLGHVLHLLEDVSVPDHTRNDQHAEGSPYESFTKQFNQSNHDERIKNRLSNKIPVFEDGLDNYFNSQAKYSNNNFYSEDTIGASGGYELPVSDYEEVFGGYLYGMKKNKDGSDYRLFVRKSVSLISGIAVSSAGNISLLLNDEEGGDAVLVDYWRLLSVSAVRHGAGMLNLFFEEAERAKQEGRFQTEEEKGFFANTWDAVTGWWDGLRRDGSTSSPQAGSGTQSGNLIDVIPLDGEDGDQSGEAASKTEEQSLGASVSAVVGSPLTDSASSPQGSSGNIGEVAGADMERDQSGEVAPSQEERPLVCSYNTGGTPSHAGMIINEVAWMGTTISANDEWIELKNITSGALDVSGWQIIDQGDQIHVTLSADTNIEAGEFLLLERSDDSTVPNIAADFIYSGALANSSEGLRLFDNKCNLIDEVTAVSSWPAGNNTTKSTMERISGFGWQTSSVTGGTPKANNSTYSSGGGSGGGTQSSGSDSSPAVQNDSGSTDQSNVSTTTADQSDEVAPPPFAAHTNANHILISEIQAGAASSSDEFIELYNPTDAAVDLTGWELRKETSSGAESNLVDNSAFAGTIPAKGFFLIASPAYSGATSADLIYSVLSGSIAYTNNSIILYNGDHASAQVVDEVSYSEIAAGKSLERKAYKDGACVSPQSENEFLGNGCDLDVTSDFELRETPKSQNTASLSEPRAAPAAINDLDITFSTSSLALLFNWGIGSPSTGSGTNNSGSSSTGQASSATSYFYEVKEYASSSDASIYNGTSTTFSKGIDEVGRDYRFSISVRDKDGLTSEEVFKDFQAPGILSGIYFYQAPTSSIFGNAPILELRYAGYPFLPDLTSQVGSPNWRTIIFYKNIEAPKSEFLDSVYPVLEFRGNALQIEWEPCSGSMSFKNYLLLPDDESRCGIWGGFMNMALRFSRYLAGPLNSLFFKVHDVSGSANFSPDDFLTVAYYGFFRTYPQGTAVGANNNFRLLAVDKTKYFFNSNLPERASPELSGEINLEYSKAGSIALNWNDATDADTERNLIKYEVNFSTSTEFLDQNWQNLGRATSTSQAVLPGESWLIGARAKDDFGNYSNILTKEWSHPPVEFLIEQLDQSSRSNPWGEININCRMCVDGQIDSASLQSFSNVEDFSFNKVLLEIKRSNGTDGASYRLSVYGNSGLNRPDFSDKIAEAQSGGNIFYFTEPVIAEANKIYWFVLDARYGNSAGYFRNSFSNAISTASSFDNGVAGMGASGECGGSSYCPTTRIPYPTASSDWYMKIGLEE